jgi:hypothetical protein
MSPREDWIFPMWMQFCSSTRLQMRSRFLIDAVVLLVPENKVEPGFSWQARSINILVTRASSGFDINILMPFISRFSFRSQNTREGPSTFRRTWCSNWLQR